jgi:hypothetical protein
MTFQKFASTWLLFLMAAALAVVFFLAGNGMDAPGVVAVGLAFAFLFVLYGLYNMGVVKPGYPGSIAGLVFGVAAITLSLVLLFDGEFGTRPWSAIIGVIAGGSLTGWAIRRIRALRMAPEKSPE